MGPYKGDFTTSDTVYFLFDTFSSDDPSASVTCSGLATTDIEIYKNGSTTQRSSESGYTLLDTDGIDFDGLTGIHGFSVDLSDNDDAGFYTSGGEFDVIVSSITVDGATVSFHAGSFSIDRIPRVNVHQISDDASAADNLELITEISNITSLTVDASGHLECDVVEIEGADPTDTIRDAVVDDATRIDASALNTHSAITAAGIVNEWETQSQADPTGFHVNVLEVNGTAQTANDNGADINAILTDTNELQVDWTNGGRLDLILDDVLLDTAEIGAAGVGLTEAGGDGDQLTAVPWNAAWDAEVQSEVQDAIEANALDHLAAVADADDVADDSIIAKLAASDGDWSGFSEASDSLEAIRDRGDAAWTTGAGTGLTPIASGTAQGGTAGTIQLAAGHTFGDNILNGCVVNLLTGTGAGQSRLINGYTGATDTAAVTPNWETNPDATTTYEIVAGSVNVAAVSLTAQTANDNGADINAVLLDTNELQTDWADGGRLDLIIDAIKAVTDNLPNAGALTDLATAAALAVVDGNVDTLIARLTAARAGYLDALNGHTAQTGDSFARLGAPAGASVSADIAENQADLNTVLADTNELQTDWADGGRLDVIIDAVKAVTDNLPNGGALTDLATAAALAVVDGNVDAILLDTGTDGVVISAATAQDIADEILKRGVDNVEDAANAASLAAIILATLESSLAGNTWSIRKTDGTLFTTKTVTVDATADPITGVT